MADRRATAVYGAIAGAGAFLAGLVLAIVLDARRIDAGTPVVRVRAAGESIDVPAGLLPSGDGSGPAAYEVGGWLYHQAHFVPLETDVEVGTGTLLDLVAPDPDPHLDLLLEPSTALYLVPIVLLLGAGALASTRVPADERPSAIATGGAVALGYGTLAAFSGVAAAWGTTISVEVSEATLEAAIHVQPDVTMTILVSGIAYPLTLGTAGAVLATRVASLRGRRDGG